MARVIVGVGMDLIDILRIERLLARKGDRALARLFTQAERDYALVRARPAQHLASRLAAKEAAFKALSGSREARAIGWRDIEVVVQPDGRPTLAFHDAARHRAELLCVTRAWVTMTHSATTAGAVVVLEREAPGTS